MAVLLLAAPSYACLAAGPELQKSDVFTAGAGGYEVYRIPGIIVTPKGALLAYAEGRKSGSADWGAIDIVMRRSEDGGSSWSQPLVAASVPGEKAKNPVAPTRRLDAAEAVTYNNPVAVAGQRSGVVHFLFCLEYMRAFYMRSLDDGRTFSKPMEITSAFEEFRPRYSWKVIATGPGHGIQRKNGRLIVPVWLSLGTGGNGHRPSVASTIYSDDDGVTWHAGEIVIPNTSEWVNPSEATVAELASGRVMLNARTESKAHRRLVSISPDGAARWSEPRFQEELAEPVCFGALARLSGAGDGRVNRLLFVNPDNLASSRPGGGTPGSGRDRKNLTVQLSYDEGESWAVKRVVEPGWSGYADIAASRDGSIYVLYERGKPGADSFRVESLALAVFDLEWLTRGGDRLKN